jgi:hypothetical protein
MFKECTEERYDEMLGILPPAHWTGKGFLVGEPSSHRKCKVTGEFPPTYAAFIFAFRRFCESTEAMTIPEFDTYDVNDLPLPEAPR